MTREKKRGILWLSIAYVTATVVATITVSNLSGHSIIAQYFAATLAATLVIFVFSWISGNSSFYDPYWSVQPLVIIGGLFLSENWSEHSLRFIIVGILVALYSFRLTYNFLRGWPGLAVQDWRYDDLKKKHGKAYWWVSFGGIHFLPTLLVFAGSLGLFVLFDSGSKLNVLDLLAITVTLGAICLEAVADQQLYRFKKDSKRRGGLLKSGVWKNVRFPNYLGEIAFWWGLYLFVLAARPSAWWLIIGPLAIHGLFVFVSIPMKDKRMLDSRKEYKDHMRQVPALFPHFWSR